MKDELLKRIKQLPPLPESAIKIESIYQDPDSSFMDMVRVLEKDSLLTADILKAANSPLYGFSREVTSVERAVSLFGMGAIRGFALASIVKKSFSIDLSPYGLTTSQFSKLSSEESALVTNWYSSIDRMLLNVLSPSAFLIEIGKVLISQIVLDNGDKDAFKAALASGKSSDETERQFTGMDTAEVSATIFDHWRFDSALVNTIKYSSNPSEAPDETKTASQILQIIRTVILYNTQITDESLAAATALITEYGLDADSFLNAVNTLKEQ
jgi:HD-like signal output (HDOD) protein